MESSQMQTSYKEHREKTNRLVFKAMTYFNFAKEIFADYYCLFIVSKNNELYGTEYNEDGQLGLGNKEIINIFIKIIINNIVKPTFYFSFSSSTFISDNKNNIYISGGTDFRDFGISLKDSDYLLEFTKIDLKLNSKYINILPLDNVKIFIGTDYKINNENEENILGEKCFKVLQNKKLIDLFIYCDNNYKKRKRNEIYL